jgi:hypothetical protein
MFELWGVGHCFAWQITCPIYINFCEFYLKSLYLFIELWKNRSMLADSLVVFRSEMISVIMRAFGDIKTCVYHMLILNINIK